MVTVFKLTIYVLDKKTGAKRPREATENSPVAIKIKSKTKNKSCASFSRPSTMSRYKCYKLSPLKPNGKNFALDVACPTILIPFNHVSDQQNMLQDFTTMVFPVINQNNHQSKESIQDQIWVRQEYKCVFVSDP